jgi:hypothetical protein
VDGAAPLEVPLAGAAPEHHSLPELVVTVNTALGDAIAGSDGTHLLLTSPTRGAGSRIELAAPAGTDATAALLGFAPPRSYHGADAGPARAAGTGPLPPSLDLSTARFLQVGVDAGAPADVDCASQAASPDAVAPAEVVAALEAALGAGAAAVEDGRLVIRSHAVGAAAVVRLEERPSPNAAELLLGVPEATAEGSPPKPATIDGVADLLLPVDLSRRSVLRLAVDGGPPFDVDVAGPIPRKTILAEVVTALNDAVPGLATPTPDDRLRLTSPTSGVDSSIAVLPLRTLEVIEFPEQEVHSETQALGHGSVLRLENLGVGDGSGLELRLTSEQGVAGPSLLHRGLGLQVRALVGLGAGETLGLWRDGRGLAAEILPPSGPPRRIAPHRLAVGLLGTRAPVPFDTPWHLAGDEPALQLDDPLEPSLALLRARLPDPAARQIEVTAAEAAPDAAAPAAPADSARIVGRLRRSGDVLELEGVGGNVLARCRPTAGQVDRLEGRVVAADGRLEDDTPPILVARSLHAAYDVVIRRDTVVEPHQGVTIGSGAERADNLSRRILSEGSQLVVATDIEKAAFLELAPGRSEWIFLECLASRYDEAEFDHATFADGLCVERGIFDVSRFANAPPETVVAVFAEAGAPPQVAVGSASWTSHAAGAFVVNLPADLAPRFGGRFDEERFAVGADAAETYEGAVFEPSTHLRYLETLIKALPSKLVTAAHVDVVPLGWDPVSVPFRKPRPLTLGGGTQAARIYLAEPGVPGFLELAALKLGASGNQIRVAARKSGPARFDVSISFEAGRFESARRTVLGATLPAAAAEVLKPGPIGVLHAKAAGVHAAVTRERAAGGSPETDD